MCRRRIAKGAQHDFEVERACQREDRLGNQSAFARQTQIVAAEKRFELFDSRLGHFQDYFKSSRVW